MMTFEDAAVAALGVFLNATPKRRIEALFWSQLPGITEWVKKETRKLKEEQVRRSEMVEK